jgi:hypothetical protein
MDTDYRKFLADERKRFFEKTNFALIAAFYPVLRILTDISRLHS